MGTCARPEEFDPFRKWLYSGVTDANKTKNPFYEKFIKEAEETQSYMDEEDQFMEEYGFNEYDNKPDRSNIHVDMNNNNDAPLQPKIEEHEVSKANVMDNSF